MARRFDTADPGFDAAFDAFLREPRGGGADVDAAVAGIVEGVRTGGFAAVADYGERFDRVRLDEASVRVTADEIAEGAAACPAPVREALAVAARRIRTYHERQRPADAAWTDAEGVRLGWRWTPLDSVGVYVPGGRAAYPSSLLMNVVPAQAAGVGRIAMITPPGRLSPAVLAAAAEVGLSEIWRVGGAHGVAALAYGAGPIARVDKIVGPGNAYVNEAKRQVFGLVGIDQLAGPSEIFVVADETGDAVTIAVDLLAQAEHDVRTRVGLVTTDRGLAQRVMAEVERQLAGLSTGAVAGAAWRDYGEVVVCADEAAMIAYSDHVAAEHLQVHTRDPHATAARLSNYGSLFIGTLASVVYSDKCCGTNHTLPTMAAGRYTGGLWVGSYLKTCTHQWLDERGVAAVGPPAMRQSASEGLEGHRRAAALRLAPGQLLAEIGAPKA